MTTNCRLSALLVALLACGPALAQDASSGRSGGSWTDPPARTAPETSAAKPAEPPAASPEPARAERPEARAPRSAKLRRESIRRAASRAVPERRVEAARTSPRPNRLAERRASPRAAARERQASPRPRFRGPVYGYADPVPVFPRYGRTYAGYPVSGPSDDWDEVSDELRARRIARARAAGYLVMRSRSYAYPDGTVVRRYGPLGAFDAED